MMEGLFVIVNPTKTALVIAKCLVENHLNYNQINTNQGEQLILDIAKLIDILNNDREILDFKMFETLIGIVPRN